MKILLLVLPTLCQAALPGTAGSVPTHRFVPQFGVHPPGINGGPPQTSEAEAYLNNFGYITKKDGPEPPTAFDFQMGLLRFQMYHGLYRSGLYDVETEEKMSLHRCENPDMDNGAALRDVKPKGLWKKKVLTWSIQGNPANMDAKEAHAAVAEAFQTWEGVADFRFVQQQDQLGGQSDILVAFEPLRNKQHPTVISRSGGPAPSKITLDSTQRWGHKFLVPGDLPLLRVVTHSIGHSLGLQHTPELDSLMNPLFKSYQLFSKLEHIPTEDNVSLRKLYVPDVPEASVAPEIPVTEGPAGPVDEGLSIPVTSQTHGDDRNCPQHVDSVTSVSDSVWYFFRGYNVWQVKNQQFVGEPVRIKELFPGGPDFVNATVTSNGLTVLFADRNLYGYEYDAGRFVKAQGFPRELHERVLFFPQAAFPLTNGSVVLLSGNVFATYDVVANQPHILNDKNRMFPNLPEDVRSGIPIHNQDFTKYHMFDETTVSQWDSITHESTSAQPLNEFFKCASQSATTSKTRRF
ncbi:unnamed protein product, partial [Mesorhabditis spiculigera]